MQHTFSAIIISTFYNIDVDHSALRMFLNAWAQWTQAWQRASSTSKKKSFINQYFQRSVLDQITPCSAVCTTITHETLDATDRSRGTPTPLMVGWLATLCIHRWPTYLLKNMLYMYVPS